MRIQFATQSYKSKSRKVSAQRCVNMYAAAQPPRDAKTDVAVFGCPGIVEFATAGTGPIRGLHELDGVVYALSGGTLYSIAESGATAVIGSSVAGSNVVAMDDNGSQLCITNGENGFVYASDIGFVRISDVDFRPAYTVSEIDGYFCFDVAGTNEFQLSDSLSGTAFSDLFASAERKSDHVVAVLNHLQNLYVFGSKTIEPFSNVGAANFPFRRIEGAAIDHGIIGPYAVASYDQKLHLVGNDRVAYRISGGAITPVSTDAINEEWQGYATVTDAFVYSYTFEGRRFTVVTFPSIPATWVLDANTGLWHERVSWDPSNLSYGRWRGNCAIEAYGKVLIGDQFSGRIGYLDAGTFTEFGNTMQGRLISPPIHGDGKRAAMPWFELDVQTGKGATSGQGSDPQIMLDISDDGGETFVDQQPWQSLGKIGEYTTQCRWDRLGSFYERCLGVTITDPVPRVILAARCPGLRVGT